MKNTYSIINSLREKHFSFLNSGLSLIKTNHSPPNSTNRNIKIFPKINFYKKYNRNLSNFGLNKIKTNSQYYGNKSTQNKNKKSFEDLFNVLNLSKIERKKSINDSFSYISKNDKSNEKRKEIKSLSELYQKYKEQKSRNDFEKTFIKKCKMTDYKVFLSRDYEKNNKDVIDIMHEKFKQRNHSLLNIIKKQDCFFIKGLKCTKYLFYPHQKLNVLAFHKNIMFRNVHSLKDTMENFSSKNTKIEKEKKRIKILPIKIKNLKEEIEKYQKNSERLWNKKIIKKPKINEKTKYIINNKVNDIRNNLKLINNN